MHARVGSLAGRDRWWEPLKRPKDLGGSYLSPVAGLLLVFIFPNFPAAADTLEWALLQAYQNNPSLNAQRAALRATGKTYHRLCRATVRN